MIHRPLFNPRLLLSLFIFIAAAALYISTAPPGIIFDGGVSGDSAELQRVAYRQGIAHSTGYPLWTMIAHLAAKLGEALGQAPYTWVTYFSSVTSAAALTMFFQAALLVGSAPAALAATGAVAFADTVWQASTIAEVQGLHMLTVAAMLWMILLHLRHPERSYPLYGLALLAGIGLANHRTIVLIFPAAGLAVLLTRRLWKLKPREMLVMLLLGILPLTSYAYLYWRVTDPHVVFSTRPTWYDSTLTPANMTDLIRGTFQGGQSLSDNFDLSVDLLDDNFLLVAERLAKDFTPFGVIAGLIGIWLMLFTNWRLGLVLLVYALPQLIFLMAWTIPKSPIYQFPLLLAFALGLTALFSELNHKGTDDAESNFRKSSWRLGGSISPVVLVITALPVFWLAFHLGFQNQAHRDRSHDNRTAHYQAELARLPDDAIISTLIWQPETFIILEYLDSNNRQSPLPAGSDLWWVPLDQIRNPALNVFVGLSMRSTYGLYGGATWFQEQESIAFSGTETETFLQATSVDDPRLSQEANAAVMVNEGITPQIELYSYMVDHAPEGFYITLYWKANTPMTESYSVYTHLRVYGTMCDLATMQTLLSQDDSYAPVQGAMPTRIWREGQFVRDTYFIPWRGDLTENTGLAFGMTLNGERAGEFCLPLE